MGLPVADVGLAVVPVVAREVVGTVVVAREVLGTVVVVKSS
jgi:hypothetical protein